MKSVAECSCFMTPTCFWGVETQWCYKVRFDLAKLLWEVCSILLQQMRHFFRKSQLEGYGGSSQYSVASRGVSTLQYIYIYIFIYQDWWILFNVLSMHGHFNRITWHIQCMLCLTSAMHGTRILEYVLTGTHRRPPTDLVAGLGQLWIFDWTCTLSLSLSEITKSLF